MKNSRIQDILLNDYSKPFDVTEKIGPHYQTVLNFWLYVENLVAQQILTLCEKADELWKDDEDWNYYYCTDFKKKLEKFITESDIDFLNDALFNYACEVCVNYRIFDSNTFTDCITFATQELIIMDYLLEESQELAALKLFDIL